MRCGASRTTVHRSGLGEIAGSGMDKSHHAFYLGTKLMLITTVEALCAFSLAHLKELDERLQAVHLLHVQPPAPGPCPIVCDKGFAGAGVPLPSGPTSERASVISAMIRKVRAGWRRVRSSRASSPQAAGPAISAAATTAAGPMFWVVSPWRTARSFPVQGSLTAHRTRALTAAAATLTARPVRRRSSSVVGHPDEHRGAGRAAHQTAGHADAP